LETKKSELCNLYKPGIRKSVFGLYCRDVFCCAAGTDHAASLAYMHYERAQSVEPGVAISGNDNTGILVAER
jgi:hypothetical protein